MGRQIAKLKAYRQTDKQVEIYAKHIEKWKEKYTCNNN